MKHYPKMSEAKKRFWAQFSPQERKRLAIVRAKKMWTRKTATQRQAQSQLMLKAKQAKNHG